MFPRLAANRVKVALADTPVVLVMGPRQCGKTTLVKSIIDDAWEYITLDDRAQFEIARADPVGFVRNLPSGRVALDEVQRVPELFVSIKQVVDEDRTPGRFLLTGSANALLLPRLSDSLAGRMESVPLTTLSECELRHHEPAFLPGLLRRQVPSAQDRRVRDHLLTRVIRGCFPEPVQRATERRSNAWYRQYVNTLIQRDIRDFTHIDHPGAMTELLKLTAIHTGKLVNLTELGNRLELDCCFALCLVGSPRVFVGVFRRRIAWDDGAIREPAGAGGVAFPMNRCCTSGEDVGARAPSVGKRWGSASFSRACPHAP